MATIGFIGLGNMGLPMAGNLVKKGHEVKGFDLVAANLEKAAARGVKKAASAADAAGGVDAVVTMLPAGKDTLAVWGGGMLEAAAPGTLVIDTSTIDVASARAAHKLAGAAAMLSLDAPVSGGVGGRGGGDADLHGRRRQGGIRQGQADPGMHGQARRALRRGRRRPGRQDLQQHDAGHQHDRRVRGLRAGGEARPVAPGAVRGGLELVGAVLVAHQLLPGAGPGAERAVQQQVQAGLCLRAHAQGPQAGAGGGQPLPAPRRRWARPPRRCSRCTTPGAKAAPTSPASSI